MMIIWMVVPGGGRGGQQAAEEVQVMSVSLNPLDTDHTMVSIRSSRVNYMTMSGKVVKTVKPKRWILQQEEHSCFRLCGRTSSPQRVVSILLV
jgi:hypothetical protein